MLHKILGFWIVMTIISFYGAITGHACIGRMLYVGVVDTVEGERIMAEMLVLLINERTGTTIKIRLFDNNAQLYKALQSNNEGERADMIIEDSGDAMAILKRPRLGDLGQEYTTGKELYEKEFNLIWLNHFGFTNLKKSIGGTVSAPLVRRDVLANFPLLPRVLSNLSKKGGAVDNEIFTQLLDRVRSGDKPKNVAKDFLKAKKLI